MTWCYKSQDVTETDNVYVILSRTKRYRCRNLKTHATIMADSSPTASSWKSRQIVELDLFKAMYPDQVQWHDQRQELTYTSQSGATIDLRLPDGYPEIGHPILLGASNSNKQDLRDHIRKSIDKLKLPEGEEMLDAIIQDFEDYLSQHGADLTLTQDHDTDSVNEETFKTTIVWLHHLLNTNKRKLATNPTFRAADIVGVTKPGYPGVLVYSGKVGAVDVHVTELKSQRWQAFQVRFEETGGSPWKFAHSSGVSEVETMADIASAISGEVEREKFLRAMNIK